MTVMRGHPSDQQALLASRDLTTTLAEHRVGSSWSVMPTPNPTPPQGRQVDAELLRRQLSGTTGV